MNTTTIQIEKPTKEILSKLKENYSVSTYDEVIRTLIKRKHKSMYGAFAKKEISVKKMMKDLRDKNDRF